MAKAPSLPTVAPQDEGLINTNLAFKMASACIHCGLDIYRKSIQLGSDEWFETDWAHDITGQRICPGWTTAEPTPVEAEKLDAMLETGKALEAEAK